MIARVSVKGFVVASMGMALWVAVGCAQQRLKTEEAVTSLSPEEARKESLKSPTTQEEAIAAERKRREETLKKELVKFESELIHFDFDEFDIRPDMRPILDRKARFLLSYPSLRIQIEGHCDERGTPEYNVALGHRRSQSVKDYLVSWGVSSSRLDTVSYGEERPLDHRHNEAAWAKNRRAKFIVMGGISKALN